MITGFVRLYDRINGGVITPDRGNRDIAFRPSPGLKGLMPGTRVEFDVEDDFRAGRHEAVNVRLAETGDGLQPKKRAA